MDLEKYKDTDDSGQIGTQEPQYGNLTFQELRDLTRNDAQFLHAFALQGGMIGVYPTEGLPLLFVGDPLLQDLHMSYGQFMEAFDGKLLNTIHPQDRERYQKVIQEAWESGQRYDKVFRLAFPEGYSYVRDIGKKARFSDGTEYVIILRMDVTELLYAQRELEKQAVSYEARNRRLEMANANIPGGLCMLTVDEEFTLNYANSGFYRLIGYTEKEFEEERGNRVLDLICDKDLAQVREQIQDVVARKEKEITLENRIIHKDGNAVWLLVKGFVSYTEEYPELTCSMMDISERKKIEDEAKMSEERFRIALALTDNTIFEYDISSRVMIHGDRSAEAYGLAQYTDNVPQSLLDKGMVHPESAEEFLGMYERIRSGSKNASCLVRTWLQKGCYSWRKIIMTAIFDENGNPVKAVGVLEDVDEQIRREKKLRKQMEQDSLTGLYNRGALIAGIRKKLEIRKEGTYQAVILLDIDDFKQINDQYGHMYGDFVLCETARRIARPVRRGDLIGRIGGDEFLIFLEELPTEQIAVMTARRVVNMFRSSMQKDGIAVTISSSAGVSICPNDGDNFEDLYQKADLALYDAKKSGKNHAVRYLPDMTMHSNTL